MRKLTLVFIVVITAAAIWLPFRKPATHRMNLTTCFRNSGGLRSGAAVRVDGVTVGSVTSVHIRPELGERPTEVLFTIETPYDLAIPNDSTVLLSTEGVLGPTFVDIDIRHAHGVRIGNNGVLTSSEVTDEQAKQAVKRLGDALSDAIAKTAISNKAPNTTKPNDPAAK
ncbi:hypothetical protein SBA7_40021 [Candidatus Sulfotelmatobacter sp. SbA7]|nr:hypothetical protein SBA7_40021 [Candidatus Sulfotelmatobacter sp. SbA7]